MLLQLDRRQKRQRAHDHGRQPPGREAALARELSQIEQARDQRHDPQDHLAIDQEKLQK